jgi:hypothetical protein
MLRAVGLTGGFPLQRGKLPRRHGFSAWSFAGRA